MSVLFISERENEINKLLTGLRDMNGGHERKPELNPLEQLFTSNGL